MDLVTKDGFIIIYEEQLKAGHCFPLDAFYVDLLAMTHCSVAQLHPNSWTLVAIKPFARVFLSMYSLLHWSNNNFYYLSLKSNYGLFFGLPSSAKH